MYRAISILCVLCSAPAMGADMIITYDVPAQRACYDVDPFHPMTWCLVADGEWPGGTVTWEVTYHGQRIADHGDPGFPGLEYQRATIDMSTSIDSEWSHTPAVPIALYWSDDPLPIVQYNTYTVVLDADPIWVWLVHYEHGNDFALRADSITIVPEGGSAGLGVLLLMLFRKRRS